MRSFLITAVCVFTYICSFAQFGGGTGTESDPYRIYTISHLEEIGDSLDNGNYLYDRHFRLMNDIIDDSLTNMLGNVYGVGFCGNFYGGGHTLALNINSEGSYASLFYRIGIDDGDVGYIDSLRIVGNLSSNNYGSGICCFNHGTIYKCVTKLQRLNGVVNFGGISKLNLGNIISCANYTNVINQIAGGICYSSGSNSNIVDCQNYGNLKINGEATGGICAELSHGNIIGCANYGELTAEGYGYSCQKIGGIVGFDCGTYEVGANQSLQRTVIRNCKNYGTISSTDTYFVGGIVGDLSMNVSVENCSNYGNVSGQYNVGGIVGQYAGNDPVWVVGEGYVYPQGRIINCFNSGHIQGESAVGGIAGSFASYCGDTLAHCLNIGKVEGSAICSGNYDYEGWDLGDSIYYDSNYYDAQMLVDTSANEEGMYEWRFTSQLTGDTPELRAMLGDGWSYAEGRYPIPLGLENDSLAMLFATPIYLYAESNEEYDDVDLVQHHFSVGTENNVSWASGSRLNIVGENATILASGSENVTASLAGYSFTRNLNLINPVIVEEQEFDDIKIFPNPASDILNITSSEPISEIEIVNVMGQVVKRIEVNSDNAVCDVEDLRSGVYVVRIHAASTTLSLRRFVKE